MSRSKASGNTVPRQRAPDVRLADQKAWSGFQHPEVAAADDEIRAWLAFSGLANHVSNVAMHLGFAYIPLERIVLRCESTKKAPLHAHIEMMVKQSDLRNVITQGVPVRDKDGKLQPSKDSLTVSDMVRISENPRHRLELKMDKERIRLSNVMKPIAGRKAGWTLLSITNGESLKRAIMNTFNSIEADRIFEEGSINMADLRELVIRRRNQRDTQKANQRTPEQRREAAKKGWKNRPKVKAVSHP